MRIAFVLKGYPRLSETFIAQEIQGLERRGLDIHIWSLRHPTDPTVHPVHEEIAAPVSYLPEYLHEEWARVRLGWRAARKLPGFGAAWDTFLKDFARDPSRNRLRRFGQACVLAAELPPDTGHLHAHFLHTPASVARYAALMCGLGWSVSAHAKDIWTLRAWEKREKLREATFAVACSSYGHSHLKALAGERADAVHLAYHGLDLDRFPVPATRNGRGGAVMLVSVGRAVAKKGYDVLLSALARLPGDLDWRLTHIGGGPLLDRLRRRAQRLGVAGRISWRGRQPQQAVLKALREADIFVLPSIIARNGDHDGLPNVLMEAQSQRLACVASRVAAIPELIEHGVTGLLTPPGDVGLLADALERLIRDGALRDTLGAAGEACVRTHFSMEGGLDVLAALFERHGIAADDKRAA